MNNSFSLSHGAATELPLLFALIAIGGIVFACTAAAFRQAQIFGSASRMVVATCVAILAVFGLLYSPPISNGPPDAGVPSPWEPIIRATTLPYAALALTVVGILIMFMLMLVVRVGRRGCASLHVWRQRFGRLKAMRQRNIRGGGASECGRLSHGGRSGQSTSSADNED